MRVKRHRHKQKTAMRTRVMRDRHKQKTAMRTMVMRVKRHRHKQKTATRTMVIIVRRVSQYHGCQPWCQTRISKQGTDVRRRRQ